MLPTLPFPRPAARAWGTLSSAALPLRSQAPVGAASQISNAVMVPNDTAVFLWNTFLQPHTISEVVAQAAEEYEAPEKKIQDSVLNFVHDTLKYQLLEEVVSL